MHSFAGFGGIELGVSLLSKSSRLELSSSKHEQSFYSIFHEKKKKKEVYAKCHPIAMLISMLTQIILWELQNYMMSNNNDTSLVPLMAVCSFTWNLPSSSLNTGTKFIITQPHSETDYFFYMTERYPMKKSCGSKTSISSARSWLCSSSR